MEHPGDREALVDEFRTSDDWFAVVAGELSVPEVYQWAVREDCGAVVLFSGTIRDHSVEAGEVRTGVQYLDYEAYAQQAVARIRSIAETARGTWPSLGRVAIIHRIGRVEVAESSVLVAVSAPHRPEAFDAARYAIDTLKSAVPIWKHETWDGGSDWGLGATQISDIAPGADSEGAVGG